MLSSEDRTWITGQINAALAHNSVPVGDDHWGADTAVGYAARKAYEIQKAMPTAAEIADAVAARLQAPEGA